MSLIKWWMVPASMLAALAVILWANSASDTHSNILESPESGLVLTFLNRAGALDCDIATTTVEIAVVEQKLDIVRKWLRTADIADAARSAWQLWIDYGDEKCSEAGPKIIAREKQRAAEDSLRPSFKFPPTIGASSI